MKTALQNELEALESIPAPLMTAAQRSRLSTLRDRLTATELRAVEGYRVRTRGLPSFEHHEPDLAFFAGLEKRQGNSTLIRELRDADGDPYTDPPTLTKIAQDFFSNLYTPSPIHFPTQKKLLNNVTNRLTHTDRQYLDMPITLEELQFAVQGLHANKSPGPDGITAEFYKTFWPILARPYLHYIQAVQSSSLDDCKNMSVTSLIYKDRGNRDDLKNYRPISLINNDLKILTKVLTNRLKTVLPKIIHHAQTAVPGRRIDNTIHALRDLIDLSNEQNIGACFIFLDQDKAFDRVDRDFLFKIMETFGLGVSFINWVRLLYANASTKLKINGFLTDRITLRRGVRQGDPLSFFAYLFVNEILALQLRSNPNIVGFRVGGTKIISVHYADDTTITITQNRCFKEVYKELTDYEAASGAKINYTKTKALWTGEWRGRTDSPLPLKFTSSNIKNLGVYFGNDNPATQTFTDILPKIRRSLNYWKRFPLTKLAKARVVEMFLLSRIWYAATFYAIPKQITKQLEDEVFDYINAPLKSTTVSRFECQKQLKHGGLNLISVPTRSTASKVHWLMRLCIEPALATNLAITTALLATQPGSIQVPDVFFTPCTYPQRTLRTSSTFYLEAIKGMTSLSLRKRINDPANEHLLYNRIFTLPSGRSITKKEFRHPGVTTIAPLLDAVDYRARDLLYSHQLATFFDKISFGPIYNKEFHYLITPDRDYRFQDVTLHLLYISLLTATPAYRPSHYQPKWHTKLQRDVDWAKVWATVHNPLSLTKTRSLIWEQIHLNFYTTYKYNKWHSRTQHCPFCMLPPENIFHILFDCPFTIRVWQDIDPFLQEIYPSPLTLHEQAFGILGTSPVIRLRNFITYVLREVIAQFEVFAYYNNDGFNNLAPLKKYFNDKLASYVGYWFYYFDHIGRPDLFRKRFGFTDVLAVRREDGSLFIADPFPPHEDVTSSP